MAEEFSAAGIILAAGRSSRMGTHKLLLPLGGKPLVAYAVGAALRSTAHPILVVIGHEAEQVRAALPDGPYEVIENRHYSEGMSSSLRAGIAAVPGYVAGAIVLLADQPLLQSRHMDLLVTEARSAPDSIVAASYDMRRGNPVYFPRRLFAELLTIEGDEGGRSVIACHRDELRLVPITPAEVALDVDRPGEYEVLLAGWERYSKMGTD